jgi:hypothetical protein
VNGFFHWDVFAGWYQVRATAAGCHAPGDAGTLYGNTDVLPVPPPQIGLFIQMECPGHVAAAPTVTGVTASHVAGAGGATVVISGSGFTGATAVHFGANAASSFAILGPGTISAVVPAGSGIVDVTVDAPGGITAVSPADKLTYLPVPSVQSLSPLKGTPHDFVTLTGSGLGAVTSVTFGGRPATALVHVSDTELRVTAPVGHGGVQVVATVACANGIAPGGATACGSSANTAGTTFTYLDASGCDGTIDPSDALAVLRAAAGLPGPGLPLAPCTGDLDGDGHVTPADALVALRIIAGIEP